MNHIPPVLNTLRTVGQPVFLVEQDGQWTVEASAALRANRSAFIPPCRLEDLGDATFRADHGLRFAYIAGAMANGIGSVEIVEAMSRAGMLGFFGAAGLPLARIEVAIDRLSHSLHDGPHGFNLIHSPTEPDHENAVVDLYLRAGVRLVEASAYLDLTLPLIRYRTQGIHADGAGRITAPNRVIAKVSRVEVASRFFAPPPARMLQELVRTGALSAEQAQLAGRIPVAQDLTAEADSGGHTDNRPLVTLLPTMIALRDRMQAQHHYEIPLRVGAAGGISTPASAAAAFVMGAAYVLTGSVNQACVESGSSDAVREMLAQAEQADVIMAPAADMFEMGVKVQVLKRGTMFAMRAAKLYELYRGHARLEDLPAAERAGLEKNLFRAPLAEIWTATRGYFLERDSNQVDRAEREPKHKMALVFRWYLGQSSRWANAGEPTRKVDYQVWCGPAMGAFNEWTKGSFLEQAGNRRVVTVARNLLYGAAVLMRLNALRCQGVSLEPEWSRVPPLEPERLDLATR
ncbi:MAG TPA: PfaD family polyunsaturated fatty acid/polyketide biosynthesis protein [Gemmataceae bacterium]|nr:PfaD family polyunsaturated fatty acid/polyketide biosynthesis protein [Gemmataceae bacterium]